MKAINDNSWFSKLKQILAIYEIPSSHNILYLPPTNNAWKKMVKKQLMNTGLSILRKCQHISRA
jgi:hypothetical protein